MYSGNKYKLDLLKLNSGPLESPTVMLGDNKTQNKFRIVILALDGGKPVKAHKTSQSGNSSRWKLEMLWQ